jgi:hypothetical protein
VGFVEQLGIMPEPTQVEKDDAERKRLKIDRDARVAERTPMRSAITRSKKNLTSTF